MAWTAPLTAVANALFTADDWNVYVRDNLNATAPGIATQAGRVIISNGENVLAERDVLQDLIESGESTTSTTYTDLATVGPSVTVTTGTRAFVAISCQLNNDMVGETSYATFAISGDTTQAGSDTQAIQLTVDLAEQDARTSVYNLATCNPGVNTFTMVYRVSGGGGSTGIFRRRRMQVMGL